MFDALVDEFRAHTNEWLRREREDLIAQQRTLHTRELAVLRVLDERGQVDCSIGSSGESGRMVRQKVETARALESLPQIAAVAFDGGLSDEQLSSVVRLADDASDAEWARRAPRLDPTELARLVRSAAKPTADDSRKRFAARSVRMWWTDDRTMLNVRGELPDEMGVRFEAAVTTLTERMKPPKGQVWDTFEHRAADALLALCDPPPPADEHEPSLAARPVLQLSVPPTGPAEIAGVPIADTLLEQLRANASIEPVLVDERGAPVAVGARSPGLSPKLARAALLRDGRCRYPGCERRRGLEVHHLVPRSWGGTDEIANLAVVCPTHHRLLVPHGLLALAGNPNQPDGLDLVDAHDLSPPLVRV